MPFKPGGSVDRMARGLASFMTYELNVPITVLNKPGAGGQLGHTYFLQQPNDGYTLLVTPAIPYIGNNILITGAKFSMDDFAFVNTQWSDWTMVATQKDKPYKTFGSLIDAIKKNPGKISTGVTFSSSGHLSTMALLSALGLKPDALRIVTYGGGGPLRSALAGGQIDFAVVQAEGSEVIRDNIRPLAAFLKKKNKMWDAPPINELLKPYGVKVPLITGSQRVLAASACSWVQLPAPGKAPGRRTSSGPDDPCPWTVNCRSPSPSARRSSTNSARSSAGMGNPGTWRCRHQSAKSLISDW
ncbi:MAG: hypothetical protein IID53_17170 [Proteobacteria bacterium]|nr:hypothetical protein [Pseudomonadota bacterium]